MNREKTIVRTGFIGIIANIFLAGFKAVIGVLTASIAIILDAVNNLTDALSSVITIITAKLAGRRPDKKHPYGYGRIEYLSTMIISVEAVAKAQATVRQLVRDTRVRKLVPAHRESVSKVARCRCSDVFRREVSRTAMLRTMHL